MIITYDCHIICTNVYINKLDEIADKNSKTYHRLITMKAAVVKWGTYIEYGVEHNDKDLKLITMWEYQNTRIFLQRDKLQVGLGKSLCSRHCKILYHGPMLLLISTVKRLLKHSLKNRCRRPAKSWKNKIIKGNGCMSSGKATIIYHNRSMLTSE